MSMTTILPRLPMTKRLKVLLGEQLDMPAEIGRIPRVPSSQDASTLVSVEAPYLILYPLWRVTSGPPFSAPDADQEWVYQVTGIGERGDQLEWMQDRVMRLFLGREPGGALTVPIEVDGMSVMNRTFRGDNNDDGRESSNPLEFAVRFGLFVTPTG